MHSDQGIGIGGITDHEHLDVSAGDRIHGLALCRENSGIGFKQVFTLHTGTARASANQKRIVTVCKRDIRVIAAGDTCE